MHAFPLWPAAELAPLRSGYELLVKAVTGALQHAREGALPPFARTLGLPQSELLALLASCHPRRDAQAPIPESKYAAIVGTVPRLFSDVTAMLATLRTPEADPRHADWLARAIAAAALGTRFLWQDLGLAGRHELTALIRLYFQPLYQRNTTDLKWKRFLFLELGALQGNLHLKPPGCSGCGQFQVCYPPAAALSAQR